LRRILPGIIACNGGGKPVSDVHSLGCVFRPAGTYKGQRINRIGEWIMNRGKIPVSEYQEFAKEFNPVNFNADEWVKMAKDAGMKYIVITAKHHDGFAMFKSNASKWNIVDATPYGKDILKPIGRGLQKKWHQARVLLFSCAGLE
jgi:hypothetical protein